MEQILKQILEKLTNLESSQNEIKSDIVKISSRIENLESKADSIKVQISDFDAKNILAISTQLNSIIEDIDYLTHKMHENQKSMYLLRKKIEVIK